MTTSAAGLAALALFVLVLGYWVPLRVQQRQELAEARLEDRFSAGLRVLAIGARGPVPALAGVAPSDLAGVLPVSPPPVAGLLEMAADPLPMKVPVQRRVGEETPMAQPRTTARTSRRALLEARAKRTRRRRALTLALLVVTAGAWAAVPFTTLLWYGALVPSVPFVVVLGLGRAAAASARRADARWAAEQRAAERRALHARALAAGGPRAPMNRARVTGRAVRGSSTMTQMLPKVQVKVVEGVAEPAEPAPPADVAAPEAEAPPVVPAQGKAWDPRPVPLPTYVTKPAAPRREPRPISAPTPAVSTGWASSPAARAQAPVEEVGEATTSWSLGAAQAAALGRTQAAALGPTATPAPAPAGATDPVATPEPRAVSETLGLPLEQILARRRAAG